MPILLANCSLLLGPYFAQGFASKFGQGLTMTDVYWSLGSHNQLMCTGLYVRRFDWRIDGCV